MNTGTYLTKHEEGLIKASLEGLSDAIGTKKHKTKIGLTGEFIAYRFLKNKYPKHTISPVNLHKEKDANFNADLTLTIKNKIFNYHVKTCKYNGYHDVSFLFNDRDHLVSTPKPNDLLILVTIYDDKTPTIITVNPNQVKLKFRKARVLKNKVALHLEDLPIKFY